jgi:uncharacterized protein
MTDPHPPYDWRRPRGTAGTQVPAVSIVESIADIPATRWDRLAASAQLYQTHAWLRWAEAYHRLPTRYLLASDGDGALLGAVATYLVRSVPDRLVRWYDPVRMFLSPFCDDRDAARHWFPVLLVGGCSGYHSEILYTAGLDRAGRAVVTRALLDQCQAIAEEQGYGCIAFMYAPKPACDEVSGALGTAARTILTSAEATIPLSPAGGLDGYLARFPGHRRRRLRSEVNSFVAAGGLVTTYPLGEVVHDLAPLLVAHQRRHGDPATLAQMAHYLRSQEEYLGADSTVFVQERDGEICGFALAYPHGETLYLRACGFDRKRSTRYAYFNLTFYEPVRHATRHGLTSVALGLGSYRTKVLRGAEVSALWSVVVPPNHLEPTWTAVLGRPSPQAVDAGVAST